MTAAVTPDRFDMGRVISRLLKVLGDNFVAFALLAVVLVGVPAAVLTVIQLSFSPAAGLAAPSFLLQAAFTPAAVGLSIAAFLISMAGNTVLQGAVIYGAVTDLMGRRASFAECLATGLRFLLPLVGIAIVAAAGEFVGYILLIVPGVILALAWCVAAPAAVVERKGVFDALSRSLDLTRNHRFAIFGLAIALLVLEWALSLVAAAALGVGGGASALMGVQPSGTLRGLFLVRAGVSLVEQTLIACLTSAGVASIYFELRQAKEGLGVNELAAVFD